MPSVSYMHTCAFLFPPIGKIEDRRAGDATPLIAKPAAGTAITATSESEAATLIVLGKLGCVGVGVWGCGGVGMRVRGREGVGLSLEKSAGVAS